MLTVVGRGIGCGNAHDGKRDKVLEKGKGEFVRANRYFGSDSSSLREAKRRQRFSFTFMVSGLLLDADGLTDAAEGERTEEGFTTAFLARFLGPFIK